MVSVNFLILSLQVDVDGVNSRPGLDSFLFFSNGEDVGHKVASVLDTLQLSQERLRDLPRASQHGFWATQTQSLFWPRDCSAKQDCVWIAKTRWRDVWTEESEGLPTPVRSACVLLNSVNRAPAKKKSHGLPPATLKCRFCPPFVPFPSLVPTQNTIISNPSTWQKPSREKWAGIQPQDLRDREGRETSAWSALHREQLAPLHEFKQPNRCSLTLSWGYHSLGPNFWAKSRKKMRKLMPYYQE